MPHIQSGRIKILAVTTAQRVPQLPDVPTIAEAGYADYAGVGWSGFVLPAGTPREIVERVSADTQAVLREPRPRGASSSAVAYRIRRRRSNTPSSSARKSPSGAKWRVAKVKLD